MTLQNKITQLLQDPENQEIVNEGQNYFQISKGGLFCFTEQLLTDSDDITDYNYSINELPQPFKLFVIRHCINLLPVFGDDRYIVINYDDTNVHVYNSTRDALLQCGAMTLEELERYAQDNNLIDIVN